MNPQPFKDCVVFLVFAPLMVPIGLGIGLRGKPYTLDNITSELEQLWGHYVYACERGKDESPQPESYALHACTQVPHVQRAGHN